MSGESLPAWYFSSEANMRRAIGNVISDPDGAKAEMDKYFSGMPVFKDDNAIQAYIKVLEATQAAGGKYGVGTPGINPAASNPWKDILNKPWSETLQTAGDQMAQAQAAAEKLPAAASSGFDSIKEWITSKMGDVSFVVLGVVIVGVALAMMAKKDVIAIVKDTAASAIE